MGQDFLSRDNVGNFTFQLIIVVVTTEFTKRLVKEDCIIKTEWIVFGYSIVLSIIKTLSDSTVAWDSCTDYIVNIPLIILNAIIISYFATASYSKITENHKKE